MKEPFSSWNFTFSVFICEKSVSGNIPISNIISDIDFPPIFYHKLFRNNLSTHWRRIVPVIRKVPQKNRGCPGNKPWTAQLGVM
jgi:hypothetical protein